MKIHPNFRTYASLSARIACAVSSLALDIPDFAGELRLMAVAWSGPATGSASRALTVRDAVVAEALLPRFLAYQVKGARNGVLGQGLRAGPAALRLWRAFRPAPGQEELYRLSAAARAYIARNDAAHRGSMVQRVRAEILAALPGATRR